MNPMEVCKMYFPYLRGRQFELIALRELLEGKRISEKVIPIIEPVKPSSTLLKTLETFVKNDREIAVVFNPTVGDFAKKLKEMREEDSKVANEMYDLLTQNDKVIKSYIMDRGILSEIKSEASIKFASLFICLLSLTIFSIVSSIIRITYFLDSFHLTQYFAPLPFPRISTNPCPIISFKTYNNLDLEKDVLSDNSEMDISFSLNCLYIIF